MAALQHYDAVIIGAGQPGVPLARAPAQSGRTTAVIEREHVGGTCINEGCTPGVLPPRRWSPALVSRISPAGAPTMAS
jgi:flavin-dependent dehydrogenase